MQMNGPRQTPQFNSNAHAKNAMAIAHAESMKVSELRTRLQAAGLNTDGRKADLVLRYAKNCVTDRSIGITQSPQSK